MAGRGAAERVLPALPRLQPLSTARRPPAPWFKDLQAAPGTAPGWRRGRPELQPPGSSRKLRGMLVAAELKGRRAAAAGFFKTTNFSSFMRQLSLYGFRKVGMLPGSGVVGPGPGPGPEGGQGNGGNCTGPLHRFRSPHFYRDHPALLVHLKRLAKGNKAKMAAGLDVTSRPPNRFQRLLGMPLAGQPLLPPSTLSNANRPGLLTGGQFHQLYGQGVFPPYSYTATSCRAPSTSPAQRLDPTPVPSTWIQQGPLGLLPGQGASPAFPDKGAAFPVLQTLPTGATYTLQPVASLPPLQQGTQSVAASIANCSSSASSVPYSQACYPTESSNAVIL
ncbi:heat shock factor protein 5-like [Falco biarmicus]|uniref:heat shock factor protein 5-like n=1 Tax=Falco biarmicus TaxID=345155 RepID=UPI0024BC07A6|nr:heat shock factor protein 5-like [Falco biarmicus]XP_056182165.1 heat shock factor protein 5-like [Falco biarmicus]XP_056182167.1 heat shock factor protein 5-like [Falco biarmicus]